ncbi:MAG: DUF2231 domain-containing protein [Candidatus Latescibacteria bacterium]|nr:DUF2231 domain-containing protein [Candidatus Latescibacterota bacterium]
MDTWHPLLVHFPIVLLPLSVGLDLAALVRRQPPWHGVAYGLLCLGALSSAAAVLTGNTAADPYRQHPQLQGLVGAHEDWATSVLLLFFALALARLPLQLQHRLRTRAFGLWLVVALAGCALVWMTGYSGGELVYQHGAGVNIKP